MSQEVIPASPSTKQSKQRKFRRRIVSKQSKKNRENDCCLAENVSQISNFVSMLPGCSSWFDECSQDNIQKCAVAESSSSTDFNILTVQQIIREEPPNQTVAVTLLDSQTKLKCESPGEYFARNSATSTPEKLIIENSLSDGPTEPTKNLQNDSLGYLAKRFPSSSRQNVSFDNIESFQSENHANTASVSKLQCDSLHVDSETHSSSERHNASSKPIDSSQPKPNVNATSPLNTNEVKGEEENIDFAFNTDFLYDTDDDTHDLPIQPANCSTFFAQAKILDSGNQANCFAMPTKFNQLPDHPVQSVKQFSASQYCPPPSPPSATTITPHSKSSQDITEMLQNSISFLFPELHNDCENRDEIVPTNEQKCEYQSYHKDVKSLLDEDDDWFDEAVLQQLNSSPLNFKHNRPNETVENIENEQPLQRSNFKVDTDVIDAQITYSDTAKRKSKYLFNVKVDEEYNHLRINENDLRNMDASPGKKVQVEVANAAKRICDLPFRIQSIAQILKESKMFNTCDFELLPDNNRLKTMVSNKKVCAVNNTEPSVREADQARHYGIGIEANQFTSRMVQTDRNPNHASTIQEMPLSSTNNYNTPSTSAIGKYVLSPATTKEVDAITKALLEDENQNFTWSQHLKPQKLSAKFDKINKFPSSSLQNTNVATTSCPVFRFTTAQDASTNISDMDKKKAKIPFTGYDVSHSTNDKFTGFKTAAGNKIAMSDDAVKRSKAIFSEIDKEFATDDGEALFANKVIKSIPTNKTFNGFKTASSNSTFISADALKGPKAIFGEIDKEFSVDAVEALFEDTMPVSSNSNFNGFKSAAGNTIAMYDDALKRSNSICDEIYKDLPINAVGALFKDKSKMPVSLYIKFNGFKTAAGNTISLSTDALKRSKSIFSEIDKEFSLNVVRTRFEAKDTIPVSPSSNFNGFKTAAGNTISISANALKRSSAVFNEINEEFPPNARGKQFEKNHTTSSSSNSDLIGFKTAAGNKFSMSADVLKRSAAIFNEIDKKIPIDEIRKFVTKVPQNRKSCAAGFRTSVAGPLMTSTPISIVQRSDAHTYSPGLTQELNDLTRAFLEDENDTKLEENCNRMKPRRLTTVFESIEGCESSTNEPIAYTSKNISNDVMGQRRYALRKQHDSQTNDLLMSVTPRTGALYIKKLISTKLTWHEMVNAEKPFSHNNSSTAATIHLTVSYRDFKFNMFNYYPAEVCQENTDGIPLPDDILLIMDENSQVGYDEIKSAFLACPYVNAAQLPIAWYDNHLKWIFDKFVAMERAYPHKFGGKILSPANVLLQLKYRYDRDVTRSEISVIRKIIDEQCVPELPFVGFVARIIADDEFEFSDGWYAVVAKVDGILADTVRSGKIRIGSKLIARCWSFDGLRECSPMKQAAGDVRIKLNANACRRVKWDTKLGLNKHSVQFHIKLTSICINGGMIHRIKAQVRRIIPLDKPVDEIATRPRYAMRKRRRSMKDMQPNKTIKLNDSKLSPRKTTTAQPLDIEIIDIDSTSSQVFMLRLWNQCNIRDAIQELSNIAVTNLIVSKMANYELLLTTTAASCVKILSSL